MAMLELQELCKSFGGLMAVAGASLRVEKGQIVGLIGPNGSGKSTLLSTVAGQYRPDDGHILFDGQEIGGLAPEKIFGRGLARSYQDPSLFFRMGVLDNVLLAAKDQSGERPTVAPVAPPLVAAGTAAGRAGRHGAERPQAAGAPGCPGRRPLRRPDEAAGAWPHGHG